VESRWNGLNERKNPIRLDARARALDERAGRPLFKCFCGHYLELAAPKRIGAKENRDQMFDTPHQCRKLPKERPCNKDLISTKENKHMKVYRLCFRRTGLKDDSCTVAPVVTLAAEDEDDARQKAIEKIANSFEQYTFQIQPEVYSVEDMDYRSLEWNLSNGECEIARYFPEIECHRLAKHAWGYGSIIDVCDIHVHEDPMMSGSNIEAEIDVP
jgi:hypothetical protein